MTLDSRGAPPLHLYAACGENRALGWDGRQPWRIPEDLRFFQEATAARTVILGRVSFDTWPRATLDGRRPIVVTSHPSGLAARSIPAGSIAGTARTILTSPSVDGAVALADGLAREFPGPICIAGGERVYAEVLASARELVLHLTLIHAEFPADRWFPEWRHLPWTETGRRPGCDAESGLRYTFLTLALPAGARGSPPPDDASRSPSRLTVDPSTP